MTRFIGSAVWRSVENRKGAVDRRHNFFCGKFTSMQERVSAKQHSIKVMLFHNVLQRSPSSKSRTSYCLPKITIAALPSSQHTANINFVD